ncbi:MAG: ATP-binding protein [Oscillospiraceae bacterium]
MKITDIYFDKAHEQLEQSKRANKSLERQRKDEIYRVIPEYHTLEAKLAESSRKLVLLIISHAENAQQKIEEIEQENKAIQAAMAELLQSHGYPADYLEPIFSCKICEDTGAHDGKWCECFNRLLLKAAADELNEVSPLSLSEFSAFSLDFYSDAKQGNAPSPREIMNHNLEFCKSYAERFTPGCEGILMVGNTGLGKTHLSLAIANEVIKRGFSVIYRSVPELMRVIEKEYFGKSDGDTISILTSSDLLILDDLGAEMSKPQYESFLYEILNARVNRGLPLIVNTNLSYTNLKSRYEDRIFSRLNLSEVLFFAGEDVRPRLPKKT